MTRTVDRQPAGRPSRRAMWSIILTLVVIVLVFAGIRVVVDSPHLLSGTLPPGRSFESRYVLHPALAYLHIVPGVAYLVGAPIQLSRRFREAHFSVHRRLGRVLIPAGLISGICAVIFGALFAFGGILESSGALVFGMYFVTAFDRGPRRNPGWCRRRPPPVDDPRLRGSAVGRHDQALDRVLSDLRTAVFRDEFRHGVLAVISRACAGRRDLCQETPDCGGNLSVPSGGGLMSSTVRHVSMASAESSPGPLAGG